MQDVFPMSGTFIYCVALDSLGFAVSTFSNLAKNELLLEVTQMAQIIRHRRGIKVLAGDMFLRD